MTIHSFAIRCVHDGLKMAEVQNGHLILRSKHHGETHVMVVSLAILMEGVDSPLVNDQAAREIHAGPRSPRQPALRSRDLADSGDGNVPNHA